MNETVAFKSMSVSLSPEVKFLTARTGVWTSLAVV